MFLTPSSPTSCCCLSPVPLLGDIGFNFQYFLLLLPSFPLSSSSPYPRLRQPPLSLKSSTVSTLACLLFPPLVRFCKPLQVVLTFKSENCIQKKKDHHFNLTIHSPPLLLPLSPLYCPFTIYKLSRALLTIECGAFKGRRRSRTQGGGHKVENADLDRLSADKPHPKHKLEKPYDKRSSVAQTVHLLGKEDTSTLVFVRSLSFCMRI